MGNIVLLDDLTINKIAAGEVIERPASVVKELMENSIDAGATNITAEIKNGGITYIRITDNGKGFLPDDMEIAFERHATSKIRSAKDLEKVKSMGFRGEALASIAAIAHVELTSRTQDSDIGYKIVVEGGKVLSKEVVGCPKGTTIIVENLFYNTPVRYKFLKKDFTELGYIEDAVTRIALVNPQIAVKLISLGKNIIQTTGNGNVKDTVYSIYGKDIAENIINVDYKFEDMGVTGCIGKPDIAKATRAGQLFFVNGRFIKDKTLTSAAEQAFKGSLPAGKYGFLILNLNIDSQKIDVNVHPAKLEIRFQDENKIFKLVYHAIKETITQEQNNKNNNTNNKDENEDILKLIKEGYNTKFDAKELEKQREFIYGSVETNQNDVYSHKETGNVIEDLYYDKLRNKLNPNNENGNDKELTVEDKQEENDGINYFEDVLKFQEELKNIDKLNETSNEVKNNKEQDVKQENDNLSNNSQIVHKQTDSISNNTKQEENNELKSNTEEEDLNSSFEEMYRKTFGIKPVEKSDTDRDVRDEKVNVETVEDIKATVQSSKAKYKYVGIVFSKYIIIEIDDELYILDQCIAQRRIVFEKLKRSYYSDGNRESQMMLLPDIIDLTSKQMDVARDNMLLLRKAGFEYEEFGENTIKLIGVPDVCIDLETKDLFKEILDEINKVARTSKNEIEERFIATIAASVAKNEKVVSTFEEVDSLMQKLLVLDKPFTYLNEIPTAIKLSKSEIEKKISKS